MLRLESYLQAKHDNLELPSLGDGEAEALYYMKYGNTPNSVFPVFWWPFLADGTERTTLLDRHENRKS